MQILGFSFNKINIERKEAHKGSVNINNNITIKTVEKKELSLSDKKQQAVRFEFEFVSKYTPELCTLLIEGEVVTLQQEKEAKDMIAKWKKDKKLEPETMASILNTALNKCNIKALVLSEEFNLPPPVPLPRVNVEKAKTSGKQKSYIG